MARKVEIEVEIDAHGQVQVHVKGRKGKGCLEFVDALQQVLGRVEGQTLTAEYHEQEVSATGTVEQKARRR
jgi:hypothetical protein